MYFPQRKPNRLSGYNYSQCGSYFLTICTTDKKPILCSIRQTNILEPPVILLSDYGCIVDRQIREMQHRYEGISLEKYVIMPNHIHLLITINVPDNSASNPSNNTIPFFVSTLKRFTNKGAGIDLWNRSYHDHIIRNDADYQKIWKYIDDNPAKWNNDCFYVAR